MKKIALLAGAACVLVMGVAFTASAVERLDMNGEKVITEHGHHRGGGGRSGGWHRGGRGGGYGCW